MKLTAALRMLCKVHLQYGYSGDPMDFAIINGASPSVWDHMEYVQAWETVFRTLRDANEI